MGLTVRNSLSKFAQTNQCLHFISTNFYEQTNALQTTESSTELTCFVMSKIFVFSVYLHICSLKRQKAC